MTAMTIAAILQFQFGAGQWDRSAFLEVRNDDWDRGAPVVQMPDCIMNANDPSWSDEDLFKNHQEDVYSALVLTNRFAGSCVFSAKMSFDHRMAPSLVVAGPLAKDKKGRAAFRDIYEIVLYEEGLNVWRHLRPNGGKSVIELVTYVKHAFKPKTVYDLKVVVSRMKAYGGRKTTQIEVVADGVKAGFRDENVPTVYHVGLLGSEGRCRFYDFRVEYPDATGLTQGTTVIGPDGQALPKVYRCEKVKNVRDCGGWKTVDGRTVRKGRIVRSAALNASASMDCNPGKATLSEKDKDFLRGTLGIRTDLDLRSDSEVGRLAASPLGPDVRWAHIPGYAYEKILVPQARDAFRREFALLADDANHPVLIHCVGGADRTGTLVFLLNGLLGVREEHLRADWLRTAECFDDWPGPATQNGLDAILKELSGFPGATLREKIEAYACACGVTRAEIERFRKSMLENQ